MGSTLVTERLIACWWISLFWERNFSDNWFVWLIKKDVLIRELVLIAIFGNVGREKKKTPKNIIHTPIDKQIHLNQNYGISRWVGYQSDWGTFLYHSVFYLSLSFNWIRSSFPLWERLIGQWTVTAEQNQKGLNINRTSFFWSKSYIILIFIDTEFNLYLLNSFKLTYLDNSIDIFNEKYSTIAIWCNSLLINVGVFSILFFLCI